MTSFTQFQLLPELAQSIADAGYVTPTPIQAQAIPHLIEGKDLLGIAQTGTGKTAAFGIPLLQRLATNKNRAWPGNCRILILAPTRELASQIHDSIKVLGKDLRLNMTVVFGGVNQRPQIQAMKRGVDILVATPGRLMDLMQQGEIRLDQVEAFVLDEADRMLDMGFIADIRRIASQLPKERQNLLFSATMPKDIAKLAEKLLHKPVKVQVTPQSTTVDRIEQRVLLVDQKEKSKLLRDVIEQEASDQVLVFSRTKHGADRVARDLKAYGIACASIHGDKSQAERVRCLDAYRSGKLRVLVATDIAARGLDVDGVSHVINYDLPNEPESYVHRIGRTARAGRTGTAISFCSPAEELQLKAIERAIGFALDKFNPGKRNDVLQSTKPHAKTKASHHSHKPAPSRTDGLVRRVPSRNNFAVS